MTRPRNIENEFASIAGEMARLTREKDWSQTPLGAIKDWQQCLRTVLGIVLNSRFPMFIFWGKDSICFYNDAYRPSLGNNGKHPSILGMPGEDAWPEIWGNIKPLIDQVMEGAGATWSEDQLLPIFRNGKIEDVYWTFSYSSINDDNGKIGGVLVTCSETTEKVLTKRKLQESERRLLTMIRHAPVSIGIFRGKNHITEIANARALEMWGKKEDEVLNKPILEVMPELISQGIKKQLDNAYNTGEIYSAAEHPVQINRHGNLKTAYINFSYEPLYNTEGVVEGIMTVGSEVTEQVISHKLIEASEEKFRLAADSLAPHVWIADSNGDFNYFNKSFFEYSGLSSNQVTKQGWLPIVHPKDVEETSIKWKESIAVGNDLYIEHRLRRYDGEYRWHVTRVKPQKDKNESIVMWIGTSTDVNEQRAFNDELEKQVSQRTAELLSVNESLKKSEERYHLMVEEVQDYAILYINRDGIVENWNAGAEKIKGYTAQEIIGKSFSNFYTDEDKRDQLPQKLLALATNSGKARQEGWRVRRDGTLFWASVLITAVHNEKREVIGFSKVTHDLTSKKESEDIVRLKSFELEQKNEELERVNKELQSFAYISSHDLQEPLRKIQTFASRIIEKENDNLSQNGKDLFRRMQNSAARMQSLIDDLLAYSRTHTFAHDFKVVNLHHVIEKVLEDLNEEIHHKNVLVKASIDINVEIIPFQLHQLFYNLISNSLKFSSPERLPIITIDGERGFGAQFEVEELQKEVAYCHVKYADNGIGFESQYNEKIFELFQRLHKQSEYQGTGIGLAIVKRIVENHKGFITAQGKLGEGAVFDIYLPMPTST